MEWMKVIGDSIQYIEDHISDELFVDDIAKHIGISSFYYQKGFSMLCGFTVTEYIRNRRLALAGNEIIGTDQKIIEIAMKYGYDSPDSFTKAFTRFHGSTPTAVRKDNAVLKSFAPLKIKVLLEGVYGDNVFEKDGIRRDRTGDGEKTRCLCGKRGIFNRDGPAMGPQIIRQLE